MDLQCTLCKRVYPIKTYRYQCECGGLFSLKKDKNEHVNITISLGEVKTPIIRRNILGLPVYLKLDYMMPTGSFKDRGALIMINKIKELGIDEVVEDSSGNAGASIAAYCAAAGIRCHIYLPEDASEGKIKQIQAYGANVIKIPGTRDDTSMEILKAAENKYYASHVYNPLFFEGTKTIAQEIYEQVGFPDYIVVPVGNGTMLLGVYLGFLEMGKVPPIIAVQSENCSPIYRTFKGIEETEGKPTLAEGIAVGNPARKKEIISAIQESGGDMVVVSEKEIETAKDVLWKMGIYVEPTASASAAGAIQYFKEKEIDKNCKIVIPLTGIGLKK